MSSDIILSNLLNPPILFFFLGLSATWVGSDLEIPQPFSKVLALYLLLAIGFHGGVALHKSGVTNQVVFSLLAALLMAVLVPFYTFFILRRYLSVPNAAAVAATYGSISAVTFIAAASFLQQLGLNYSGHMVAAVALMESPAIIVGVLLVRLYAPRNGDIPFHWPELFREAFLNGSVVVLIGSLVIGMITGVEGDAALRPFTEDIFKGVLSLFLLDMGLVSARHLGATKGMGLFPLAFATLIPLLNAGIGILLARLLGLNAGDALLFTVLCASASYIAVPAALRLSIPEANPGLYVTMALALTFPFNVIIGLPVYMTVINSLWR
jgi:uncharacterized protein